MLMMHVSSLGLIAVSLISKAAASESGSNLKRGTRTIGELELNQIDFPTIDIPTIDLPTIDIPTIDIPTIEIPTIEFPTLEFPTIDWPTIELPDWVPTDCLQSLEDLGDETADVVVECIDVAEHIPNLLTFGGEEDKLEDMCAALGDLSECNVEVFEMTEQFMETAGDCAEDFGMEAGTIPGSPEMRLTNVLMNEVLCMENDSSDRLCIVDIYNFLKNRTELYARCIGDFPTSDCSLECTNLAQEFVDSVGCCATGIIYAAEAFLRLGVDTDDVGHLTACGIPIFSCEPLDDAFSQTTTSIELPPMPPQPAAGAVESTGGGLGAGAIAGIVIAVLVLLAGAGALAYVFWWKKRNAAGKVISTPTPNFGAGGVTVNNTI